MTGQHGQEEFEFVRKFPTYTIRYPPVHPDAAAALRFLQQLGLKDWFNRLYLAVDALRPDAISRVAFREEVEDLLNEENIIGLRAFLLAADSGAGSSSEGEDDDAG